MSNEGETAALIARAKDDAEACRQLEYWTMRLKEAQEAQRELAQRPGAVLDILRDSQ